MPSQNKKDIWMIIDLINWSTQYLKDKGIDNPRTSTEILLGFDLQIKRIDLYLNYNKILNKEELLKFKGLIKKRAKQEPLQYITGSTEFLSLPFKVDPTVLIPRPETELLTETAIDKAKERGEAGVKILDIGTGSGNIAVSLAKYLKDSKVYAIDISDDILKIAGENAKLNDVKVTFKILSIFDADESEFKDIDIIISNPPYVSSEDFPGLQDSVRLYEPKKSLSDDADGLTFYKEICKKGKYWLKPDGMLFMEMGLGESRDVYDIVKSHGFSNIEILKDYQEIDRIIYCSNN